MSVSLKRLAYLVLAISVVLASSACNPAAEAPKYPTKPIDLIVPWAPGGGADMSARMTAAYASKKFGVPVNVLNVTGASGVTGMLQALNASPDGYTLLMDGNVTSSFMYATRTDLPLKIEDRVYTAMATADPMYFFANANTGWKTLKDAIDALKAKPEGFSWGAGAYGSSPMFTQVDLFTAAGISMDTIKKTKMVVFAAGNAPSIQACITGDVQFATGQAPDVAMVLATGKVVVLGTNAAAKTKEYPNIPTTTDAGFPNAKTIVWYGISGPKGLPANVVTVWDTLLKGAAADPDGIAEATKSKKNWFYLPQKDYLAYVLAEYQKMIPVATDLGIRQ
jgi:tripartite-type tricarboxylate transporter receptor subunit TctC